MASRSGPQRPNGTAQAKICQFKLVLLGESAVGKSSLVLRFVKGQFHEFQESTIGEYIIMKTLCDGLSYSADELLVETRFGMSPSSVNCTMYVASQHQEATYMVQFTDMGTSRNASGPTHQQTAFLTQTVCLDDTTVKFEIWDTAGQERYHSLAPMYYRGAQAAIVVYDVTNQDTFGRAKTWVKELQRQASPNIVIALAGNKADLANKRSVELEEAQAYAEENGLLFMETSAKTAMNVNEIFLAIAKKLPKSDQNAGNTSSQGRRLAESEATTKAPASCCK